MRTVLLGNNRLAYEVGRYLRRRDELVGLVLHPPSHRKNGAALERLGVPTCVWPSSRDAVAALEPDCLLSVLFGYRVPADWLAVPRWRALNLHPSLLPWNRGSAPNAWPLVDGSPAGVSLHVMEPTIDSGDVLVQHEVPTYPDDTAFSLYRRLEGAALAMFRETWPGVRERSPIRQTGEGSSHRMRDLASLDLGPEDLAVLDRMRARTFPPYGAEFERDGRRYRVRVDIEPLDEP